MKAAVLLGNVCPRIAVEILPGTKNLHDSLAHNPVYFLKMTFAHHIDANSKASSSGSTARKWSSQTSPQVENDQTMHLPPPTPEPLQTHRHIPWIPDLPFSHFLVPTPPAEWAGKEAQSWARPHLATDFLVSSSSFFSDMTWRSLGSWKASVFLVLYPQQYYASPSNSLTDMDILSFLRLFSLSKLETPNGQETPSGPSSLLVQG